MSTDSPLPSAPELPNTSQAAAGSSHWDYFNNQTPSQNLNADAANTTASTSVDEAVDSMTAPTSTKSTPSSTAYSFTGSSLGSESTATINKDILKSATKPDNDNSSASSSNATGSNSHSNDEDKNDDSMYECNICLDTAKDAVVSMCGHLFCWPCLHQWLETRPNRKLCPVCKAAIGKDKVIPLYGRNSAKQEDPRNKVPPRPAGQRTEPEPQQGFQGFGFGDGFHMSFGIGAFPFGYFASSFNIGEPRPAAANHGTVQFEHEQELSKLFLYLALLCMAWLLFA